MKKTPNLENLIEQIMNHPEIRKKGRDIHRKVYEIGLTCHTDSFKYNYGLGILHLDDNEYHMSLPYLEKAIKLNPNSTKTYMDLGFLYTRLKKYDEAEECTKRAVELEPNGAENHSCHAKVLCIQEKFEEALPHSQKAVELEPHNPIYLAGLGDTLKKLEINTTEALNCFAKSIVVLNKEEPKSLEILIKQITSKYGIKYLLECSTKAIELEPQNPDLYLGLSSIQLNILNWNKEIVDNARNYLRKAIELEPQNPVGYNALGNTFVFNPKEALKHYKIATNLEPYNLTYAYNLGSAYYQNGQHKRARKILRKVYRLLSQQHDPNMDLMQMVLSGLKNIEDKQKIH